MDFLKIFLRSVAGLPGVIQGVEALYGAKTGADKRKAAVAIVGAAINMTDAVEGKQIADGDGFSHGLGLIVDGVVACLNASLWAGKKPGSTTV